MSTPRRFSIIFIKLTFFFSFLTFTTLNLVAAYGLATGIYLSALCWSVYVMCLPFSGGGILFYPLAPLIGSFPNYIGELWAWGASIVLNTFTFIFNRPIYEKTSITHFIYWGITHPFPYWMLFTVSFLPVAAALLHYRYGLPKRTLWYVHIRLALIILALTVIAYIALRDIIILSNIHA